MLVPLIEVTAPDGTKSFWLICVRTRTQLQRWRRGYLPTIMPNCRYSVSREAWSLTEVVRATSSEWSYGGVVPVAHLPSGSLRPCAHYDPWRQPRQQSNSMTPAR